MKTDIDWPAFMKGQDMVWEELPLQWNEGAFCGNGQLGMMIYVNKKENTIVFHQGRLDVTDHRLAPDRKSSIGALGASVMYDFPRLDIGRMRLHPAGKIISGTMRQDLWNAEISGEIITDLGTISFTAFTPHDRMMNIVDVVSTEKKGAAPAGWRWDFFPGNPASPRIQTKPDQKKGKGYITNPKPKIDKTGDITVCVQSLIAGGDYATAWSEKRQRGSQRSILYTAIANEVPASGLSARVATRTILNASALSLNNLRARHQNWWHHYYQQSFLTIPDADIQSFYWIQLYKMGVSAREDGPAVDLFGPVFRISQWPGIWWNLNLQLTYWPFYESNHLDIAKSLLNLIDDQFDSLLENFRGPKLGDFAWAMHNYWLQYRYAGDWKLIGEKWVPKAVKVLAAYEAMMQRNADGKIELLPMGSPEFKSFTEFPNTNYNLAILHWLLNSLVTSSEKSHIHSDDIIKWKQMLADLVPYPVDENGLMIGSNQPFDLGHRHYSHLLALYPLFQLNPDSAASRNLAEKSLKHWLSMDQGKMLNGFSYTGAASLYAALGEGNASLQYLDTFIHGHGENGLLFPNTMYTESKGKNPTLETPLSAAASIMELLLQSWGHYIRIFPAVPDRWQEASFYHLRARGGFLVSAVRRQGKTQWVSVKSLSGETCQLKIPGWDGVVQISQGKQIPIVKIGKGEFRIDLKAGEEGVFSQDDKQVYAVVRPIREGVGIANYFGVKKGQQLPKDLSWPLPEYDWK